MSINMIVGGEAGQGVQSLGFLLAKVFARGGYYVFADQDYESRVRGGHNFFRDRVSPDPVGAIAELTDILIALDEESLYRHAANVSPKGSILFDGDQPNTDLNGALLSIPLHQLATQHTGDKLMANTVALGAVLGLVKFDKAIAADVVQKHFGSGVTGDDNVKATMIGYEFAMEHFESNLWQMELQSEMEPLMLLNGNEAIALGAITAGCTFMAAYPMTPASSIMEYLAAKSEEFGIAVVQSEDEIAAVNMAIGAAYAGARSMTATSGGGFCLMVEGLGLAGITETPLVVVDAQRPGPGIGLPTRTEQSDLQFVLHAAHGEFPRAVLAPATIEEAFWLTTKAFNLAEHFQIPVILLTDQHLASSYQTIPKFDLAKVTIDRGLIHNPVSFADTETYQRHALTPSGISPRAFPMMGRALVITDSDEHDEEGHLTEDAEIRKEMMMKRLRKMNTLRNHIDPPLMHGPSNAPMTLIGWGSTYGALVEAVDILNAEGTSANLVHFSQIWPFRGDALQELLTESQRTFVVEGNATGQLHQLIRTETGIRPTGHILRYDGRPITPNYIVDMLNKETD